jgi:hypothetical protein
MIASVTSKLADITEEHPEGGRGCSEGWGGWRHKLALLSLGKNREKQNVVRPCSVTERTTF